MAAFDLNSITSALSGSGNVPSGVDFSGKSLKLDTEKDAQPIVDAINACPHLEYLTLTGNTLGVEAAKAIAKALEQHPELKICRWSDMFTGRMKTEIPPALSALGDGMIAAGARLSELDLSDNAFGPIGVEGLAKLLQSEVCSQLQELRLNNNGLGITGGRLLAKALSSSPRPLRVFIAGRNRLENDGAKALAKVFEQMGTLEEVAMPQNGIYHAGVAALAGALRKNGELAKLDLNDNTIGPKGAVAFAAALPRLKNLRSINFGDCLLKSKGAKALAKGLRDNGTLIEHLDVSHNEIGREAVSDLVAAVASPAERGSVRLRRVALAGNSLGGGKGRDALRAALGDCAELTGDGSDDDDESESEEEEEEDEESSENDSEAEDSATEDAQHTALDTMVADIVKDITLDNSGVEEVETEVARFLAEPTLENLNSLGPNAADIIDVHLQSIKDPSELIQAYVEATLKASGLSTRSPGALATARQLMRRLVKGGGSRHASAWILANAMLKGLGLIKSESKDYKIRWHLPSCYSVLADQIDQEYFPSALKDTLRFFIASKLPSLNEDIRIEVQKHTSLLQ